MTANSKKHSTSRNHRLPSADRSKTAWLARVLILAVLGWNVQCAVLFMVSPDAYSGGFGLNGSTGATVVRSLGLLFLMWNIPYIFALIRPYRWKICLITAVIQQSVGLAGEISIRASATEAVIRASVLRFIQFDAAGLVLLLATLILIHLNHRKE
jgi:hypothetical protein